MGKRTKNNVYKVRATIVEGGVEEKPGVVIYCQSRTWRPAHASEQTREDPSLTIHVFSSKMVISRWQRTYSLGWSLLNKCIDLLLDFVYVES